MNRVPAIEMLGSFPFVIFVLFSLILIADVHDFYLWICERKRNWIGKNNREKTYCRFIAISFVTLYLHWMMCYVKLKCDSLLFNYSYDSSVELENQSMNCAKYFVTMIMILWRQTLLRRVFFDTHCKLSCEGRRRDAFFTFWFWFRRHLATSVIRECVVCFVSSKLRRMEGKHFNQTWRTESPPIETNLNGKVGACDNSFTIIA